MSWISEQKLSWLQRTCIDIIRTGNVPRHVAFIMDGNRRFASKQNLQKAEGHSRGFSKLAETLRWCRELGVSEITVYAFSIDNFRRHQSEVDAIMDLARDKLALLLSERDKLMEHSVCVRFIGNLTLLPLDIQRLVARITVLTRHNTAASLNVAFSYTAREEISQAVRCMAEGVQSGLLQPRDVSEHVLEKCLYTRHSPHPDLLVRTSGEVRLSDFLLWQTTHTCIHFTDVLWPDFTLWHLLAAVFRYQRYYTQIQTAREQSCDLLEPMADGDSFVTHSPPSLSHTEADTDHAHRLDNFQLWLDRRHWQYFEQLAAQTST